MKITNWTRNLMAALAAGRTRTRKKNGTWRRVVGGAVVGGSLALVAGPADAQTNHVIQDPSFDEIDLIASGQAGGTGHWDYIANLNLFQDYPWVTVGGNNNSWLYNTAYSVGFPGVSAPRSPDNAAHLADGDIIQIIADTFESGRQYTLSAWVHYDLDAFIGDDFGLRLFDGTGGMFDGAQVFAAENYTLGVDYFDDGSWHAVSITFTAGANADGKPIGIYLGPEQAANRLSVDDVTLTSVPGGLPGDYNDNGIVDAADYTVWRDNVGAATLTNRDAANSGPVDIDDYNSWKANFGATAGSGAASLSAAAVPEPATCLLVCAAAAGVVALRPR